MKRTHFVHAAVSAIFMVILLYSLITKLWKREIFIEQLSQAPVWQQHPVLMATGFLTLHAVAIVLLCLPRTRQGGLVLALCTAALLAVYSVFILGSEQPVPCACIGFFEKLTWKENMVLDFGLVLLAGISLGAKKKRKGAQPQRISRQRL